MTVPQRIIAHLDMDAFYASVELLRYPELKGMPVVIGGGSRNQPMVEPDPHTGAPVHTFRTLRGYAGRGVITTATYAARALGLHSAMGMMKAAQLAPDTVLLPVDFDEYRKYSRLFKAAVRAIAPQVEDRGIDEIYIDLTELAGGDVHPWSRARELALQIKSAVREATGLACSVGLSPNKLLSKIASDLDKPDGLTIVAPEDIPSRIWPLAPRKINGCGPKASAKLTAMGIATIGQLAQAEPELLKATFGKSMGAWMHESALGHDDRPVVTFSEPQSISRETTFERDLHAVRDRDALRAIFAELCDGVAADLQRKGYAGRTLGIKLRFDDFKTLTRDRTIETATQDKRVIRRVTGELFRNLEPTKKIRLLGIRASALDPADAIEEDPNLRLFD